MWPSEQLFHFVSLYCGLQNLYLTGQQQEIPALEPTPHRATTPCLVWTSEQVYKLLDIELTVFCLCILLRADVWTVVQIVSSVSSGFVVVKAFM